MSPTLPALEDRPTPTPRSQTWPARYALKAYAAMWLILIALGLGLYVLGANIGVGAGALLVELAFLSTLIPLWRRYGMDARDLGLRLVPGAGAAALAMLGLLAYGWLAVFITSATHPTPVTSNFSRIGNQGTPAILLAGFAACVAAPVAEEIFFRGFLYRCLRNRLTILPACLMAALMFALVHTQYEDSRSSVSA